MSYHQMSQMEKMKKFRLMKKISLTREAQEGVECAKVLEQAGRYEEMEKCMRRVINIRNRKLFFYFLFIC